MPELEAVGRVENPNVEPVTVPVIGYDLKGKEVIERFAFKPVMPAGAMSAIVRNASPDGELPFNITLACIEKCLLVEEVESWQAFLDRDDVMIERETVAGVLNGIVEYYAARPTGPSSPSASSGSGPRPTSRAAARSAASRSKKSRSA